MKLSEFLQYLKISLFEENRISKLAICELICCSNTIRASELACFNAKDAIKIFLNSMIYNYIVYL